VPVVLLLLASLIGYKIWSTTEAKEKIVTAIQYLPSIKLRKLDGSSIVTDSLKNGKDLLVLNYFNPDCEHCQSMVQELFREQKLMENVNWLMITSATFEKTKRFADSMQLWKMQKVTVLNDTALVFIKILEPIRFPRFMCTKMAN